MSVSSRMRVRLPYTVKEYVISYLYYFYIYFSRDVPVWLIDELILLQRQAVIEGTDENLLLKCAHSGDDGSNSKDCEVNINGYIFLRIKTILLWLKHTLIPNQECPSTHLNDTHPPTLHRLLEDDNTSRTSSSLGLYIPAGLERHRGSVGS